MQNIDKFFLELKTIEFQIDSNRNTFSEIEKIFKEEYENVKIKELGKRIEKLKDKYEKSGNLEYLENLKDFEIDELNILSRNPFKIESVESLKKYSDNYYYTELSEVSNSFINEILKETPNYISIQLKQLELIKEDRLNKAYYELMEFRKSIINEPLTINKIQENNLDFLIIAKKYFLIKSDDNLHKLPSIDYLINGLENSINTKTKVILETISHLNKIINQNLDAEQPLIQNLDCEKLINENKEIIINHLKYLNGKNKTKDDIQIMDINDFNELIEDLTNFCNDNDISKVPKNKICSKINVTNATVIYSFRQIHNDIFKNRLVYKSPILIFMKKYFEIFENYKTLETQFSKKPDTTIPSKF